MKTAERMRSIEVRPGRRPWGGSFGETSRKRRSIAFVTGMRITVPAHPAGTALVLAYGVTIRDEGHREHVSGQADLER